MSDFSVEYLYSNRGKPWAANTSDVGDVFQAGLYDEKQKEKGYFAVAMIIESSESEAFVDFLMVLDPFTKQGFGQELINKCRRYWKNLELSEIIESVLSEDAESEAGQ